MSAALFLLPGEPAELAALDLGAPRPFQQRAPATLSPHFAYFCGRAIMDVQRPTSGPANLA